MCWPVHGVISPRNTFKNCSVLHREISLNLFLIFTKRTVKNMFWENWNFLCLRQASWSFSIFFVLVKPYNMFRLIWKTSVSIQDKCTGWREKLGANKSSDLAGEKARTSFLFNLLKLWRGFDILLMWCCLVAFPEPNREKYYSVARGYAVGVFTDYEEVKKYVREYEIVTVLSSSWPNSGLLRIPIKCTWCHLILDRRTG